MPESFDYPERRLKSQRDWHSRAARWNKHRFYFMEIATLLAGAAIPVINLWIVQDAHLAGLLSAILGGIVVLAAGITRLFKFQENWLQYRALVDALDREQEHYRIGAGEYARVDEAGRSRLFVERIEGLLASTTSQYITTHRAAPAAEAPDQKQ